MEIKMSELELKTWRPEIIGYSDDILPYYRSIVTNISKNSKLVEVGVFYGRSALFMIEEINRLSKSVDFYGIDVNDCPEILKDRKMSFLQMTSVNAAHTFLDESLD